MERFYFLLESTVRQEKFPVELTVQWVRPQKRPALDDGALTLRKEILALGEEEELKTESKENERELIGPKQGKGKRIWKKVKYKQVEYHSLPVSGTTLTSLMDVERIHGICSNA
ncbi:hypothetical protein LguiA_017317 [Lonicera macranthoides]